MKITKSMPDLTERKLADFVAATARKLRLRKNVSVLITSSRYMRKLNARFRGKDRATDVLSFPGPVFAKDFAGDIAISQDIAARNARALRHSVAEEVKILALHGLLHLAGYDHETDGGEMAKRETALRRKLGLPSGLIERSATTRKLKLRAAAHG